MIWVRILALFLAVSLLVGGSAAGVEKKIRVIASFSIIGDLVKNVGGDRVAVITLVGPDADAHVYEPTPADSKAVAGADLVVVNGLGFEGWMERLIQTSGYKGPVVVASGGIKPRELAEEKPKPGSGHGHKIDPHAWQDLSNGRIYVDNIAQGLRAQDPGGAAVYRAKASAYQARLAELDRWVKTEFAGIPEARRRMITSHEALGYFGGAYGITILAPMGVSTESEASAGDIARLIRQIRREKITAVFMENVSDPRLMEQVAKESGAALGGRLYSDALSKPEGPAPTYLEMFKNNVAKIVAAMRQGL